MECGYTAVCGFLIKKLINADMWQSKGVSDTDIIHIRFNNLLFYPQLTGRVYISKLECSAI